LLAVLYATAGEAEAAGRTEAAADTLQQITLLDPANADAARRLWALRGRHAGRPKLQPTPPTLSPLVQTGAPPGPPLAPNYPPPVSTPPPKRRRPAGWVIALVAAVLVIAVVAGVLIVRGAGNGGTAQGGPSTAASASPSLDTPTPSAETPTPTPTPTPKPTPSYSTSNLRTHIPTDIRTSCKDYIPPAGDALEVKLIGAIRCEPTGTGVPAKVWYFEYPDTAAMDTAYAAYVSGDFKKGDCTAKRQRMDFTTTEKGKKLPGGILHCYESGGDVTFAWSHDFLRILSFSADSELSYAKMKAWWGRAGPYREP
jgi:hypothetical protein